MPFNYVVTIRVLCNDCYILLSYMKKILQANCCRSVMLDCLSFSNYNHLPLVIVNLN